MGNAGSKLPNFRIKIQIKHGNSFRISYADLIDYVLLLRQVIAHPQMTQQGPMLDYFTKDYCKRMAQEEMISKRQQLKLPWQIEWIWHVHRLHPVAYHEDCTKQLPKRALLDKLVQNLVKNRQKNRDGKIYFTSIKPHLSFVPSIDLVQAVIRQRDFLEKFQRHKLYSWTFKANDRSDFEQLMQNYVSFMKLARKKEMIVPTFDIDLMWHSHMRRPSHYHKFSTALCGFILDHDDAIEKNLLFNNYQKTVGRWKETYKTEYGQMTDHKRVETSQNRSSYGVMSNGGGYGGD